MSIFEELIEVGLLQNFSLPQVISFYSTFFDHIKEYKDYNALICDMVESFLSIDKLKELVSEFRLTVA